MTVAGPLLVIAVMVSFNARYVAAEFATVGSRRSRVDRTREHGALANPGGRPHRINAA